MSAIAALSRLSARSSLTSQVMRGGHSHSNYQAPGSNLPFQVVGKSALSLHVKVWAFMITGFSLPFVAVKFQAWKKG
ncbi:hypothetical protein CAOG_04578 [Capsaspora owczarzaki ATCC 30864]|uniref:Cytochrome c oxidase polypeptide VIIc n=1 Tax=Capsaspora owczarzaki (strain ATCC 30864) TaxID=595528 RepID=A0A0D2UFF0_CAPO3|nr:hypothetical protein CAOG_04578 [Capsaspora owczarzaki ATCC 30864]KJE93851.1 hypothetical protein CAOG_004578 [Capsaspora owczarzaki ATCC 30864]|eukprot:XP_004347325.1 hypothetical protein CAOG_04578 [Capsaspora owczarzaki ATCC 30864]